MADNPYTSQSIAGYNSSPPPDDGSKTAANKLEWQKHIDKIGDPVKTLAEAIDTNVLAAFDALILTDEPGEETIVVAMNEFARPQETPRRALNANLAVLAVNLVGPTENMVIMMEEFA